MNNCLLRAWVVRLSEVPLSYQWEGGNVCDSLETLLNIANSHHIHFMGLNIPVVIERMIDILELGIEGCCLLLIYAEQSQPYIIDNVVKTCSTFMMVNAHDGEKNLYILKW